MFYQHTIGSVRGLGYERGEETIKGKIWSRRDGTWWRSVEKPTFSLLKHTFHSSRAARAGHRDVEFIMVRRGGVCHLPRATSSKQRDASKVGIFAFQEFSCLERRFERCDGSFWGGGREEGRKEGRSNRGEGFMLVNGVRLACKTDIATQRLWRLGGRLCSRIPYGAIGGITWCLPGC